MLRALKKNHEHDDEGIGRSRGGLSSKIHCVVDGLGNNVIEMVRREKRLKNWCRKWKLNLIEGLNPRWRDFYEEIST